MKLHVDTSHLSASKEQIEALVKLIKLARVLNVEELCVEESAVGNDGALIIWPNDDREPPAYIQKNGSIIFSTFVEKDNA